MRIIMKKRILVIVLLGVLALLFNAQTVVAQENTYQSVLSEHSWYRLSVTQEGVYQLDYATLQSMGVDMSTLNPNQIRLFGNPSGCLPEKNSEARPDDLTEMAIFVTGADDGVFDEGDKVLFYGQEPTRWVLVGRNNDTYSRERNYYSDTTYYYLCVDSGVEGMRVGEKETLPVEGTTTVIAEFPDFVWHEEELLSPYFIGQNWFGEKISGEDASLSISFVFPNLVTSKNLKVKGRVYGRVSSGMMYYDVWVNDNHVVDNKGIDYNKEHKYANPSSFDKQIVLDNDTATFELTMRNHPSASLFLDYVEIYGWRRLKRVGNMFPFRLMPSQFGQETSAVWVQNTNAEFWLWEVTSPLQPVRQNGVLSSGNLVFATDEHVEKRYMMFKPSAALDIVGWTAIHNQNVHGVADAENLILTDRVFWEQAQALADYHAQKDGVNSVVVDVKEIFNEFSTGTPDPTAIRDFVRMVYLRSSGNLKYLTLFGRASADFRNIMGYGLNYVPTYETMDEPQHELSFCADDYYALMDDDEGSNCAGRVDIGVGRISVSTVAEAETVLKKIKHYDNLASSHGIWKTDMFLFADDEQTSYVNSSETLCNMLDTLCPPLTGKKVYCGAYPVVNTSSGKEIPGANADLMAAFDKGMLAMFYTGHGGVRGLTGDNVFTNADINALANYDRMPFVYTATCEFTKYDNPLVVSSGEQLFLNPNGGCVALFTACRPTIGVNNQRQTKALAKYLTQRDGQGKPLRFGDIIRLSKSDQQNYSSQAPNANNLNIRFLFLGDPVLRFAMPSGEVRIQKINGVTANNSIEIELHAMSMVSLEGEVRNAFGALDSGFNGVLWVRFYDKKSKVKVKFIDDSTRNVYYYKDVLYEGQVSVRNGKFSVSFQVPKDINLDNGKPRFSFYAYDESRDVDAMGKFDGLVLGGVDPAAWADDEGPTIKFYWDTPDFENGQSVERQGVLYADLYDAQGIYHYDYSLGRDIMLNSNLAGYNRLVLNDRYEPQLNDFRRGRISLPLYDLKPGTYEFNLKVWDTQDNPSEADLWFVVDEDLFLSQVRNYPNPFSEETRITLKHLGEDGNFDVNIEVFDILGRQVVSIHKKVSSTNGEIESIYWNGCDSYGNPLRSGVYLYRLTLTDEQGNSRMVSQRMVKGH